MNKNKNVWPISSYIRWMCVHYIKAKNSRRHHRRQQQAAAGHANEQRVLNLAIDERKRALGFLGPTKMWR